MEPSTHPRTIAICLPGAGALTYLMASTIGGPPILSLIPIAVSAGLIATALKRADAPR